MQSSHSSRAPGRWSRQYHGSSYSRAVNAAALLLAFHVPFLNAQSSLLEAHIISGEGQVSHPGSHLPRPLVVEVTDETGQGVPGALVSFRTPDNGVSGTFRNGLKSEILTTDRAGRVALHGLEAGGFAGPFQIRMTVAKGEARTGAVSNQFIAPGNSGGGAFARFRPHARWLEVGGLVATALVAVALKAAISSSGGSSVQLPPTIGQPTVTVGKP